MAVINIPASKSLTLSNEVPTGNIQDKIIVGSQSQYIYYSYLFFDTSMLPGDIVLLSATLVLFKVADFFNSPTQLFTIYPLLKQFSSYSSYENPCPIDLDPTLEQEFQPYTKDVAIEVSITALFTKWIDNTLVNRGIAIKDSTYTKPTGFGTAYSKDNMLIPFIRVHFRQNPCGCFLPQISYTASVLPPTHK